MNSYEKVLQPVMLSLFLQITKVGAASSKSQHPSCPGLMTR